MPRLRANAKIVATLGPEAEPDGFSLAVYGLDLEDPS